MTIVKKNISVYFIIFILLILSLSDNLFASNINNKWNYKNLLKETLDIAKTIEGENKDNLLADICQIFIKNNDFNKCFDLVKTIKNPQKKVLLLCDLAKKHYKIQNKNQGILCLKEAENIVFNGLNITEQADEFAKIAITYAVIEEKQKSSELLIIIQKILDKVNEYDHITVFDMLNIAQEFIKNKQNDIAKEILNKKLILNVPFGGYYGAEGKIKISETYMLLGDTEKTKKILNEIVNYLDKQKTDYNKLLDLSDVSGIYYRIGNKNKAKSLLAKAINLTKRHKFDSSESYGSKDSVYFNIGKKYIEVEEYEKMLEVLGLINSNTFKRELLTELIISSQNRDDYPINILVNGTKKIFSPEEKSQILIDIVNKCSPLKQNKKAEILSEALTVSNKIIDNYNKDFQLYSIAKEYLYLGNLEVALKILIDIKNKAARDNVYRCLTVYYVKNNEKEKYNEVLKNIIDNRTKDFALQDISLFYFKKGKLDEARNIIDLIKDPFIKGETFIETIE